MSETSTQSDTDKQIFDAIRLCCNALSNKKAEDLKVLDVREVSTVTDYFIIATGTSAPHLKALRADVERTLKDNHIKTLGSDYTNESGWLVLDCFNFMIHVFKEETRQAYGLERLWRDAKEVNWE